MDTFNGNFGTQRSAIYIAAVIATSALLLLITIPISSFGQLPPTMGSNATAPATGGGNMTSTGNATTTASQSACSNQTQTAGTNMTMGGNSTTTGNATTMGGGNMTTTANATSPASQAASDTRGHIEEACKALQKNDTQGALMHLNLALTSLDNVQGNLTSTSTAGNATNSTMSSGENKTDGIIGLG